MQRMRLAYLISRYPAISHTFILREVRGLRALGFEIATASINPPDREGDALTAAEQEERDASFYVKQAGAGNILRAHGRALARDPARYAGALVFALGLAGADLRRLWKSLLYFGEAVVVGEWMREQNLQHLHVHFAGPASSVGLIATRSHGIRLSIMIHGPDEFYDVPGSNLVEKIAGASFLVCIGRYARSQLMRLSHPAQWSKFEIAALGVDPERFAPVERHDTADAFEVLCVGRLVEAKGQPVLVRAIERLVQAGRKVHLRLVGDGPHRAMLESEVARLGLADSVSFEGAVNQDRIRALYARADVFAMASFAEGIPVVLMEAMSMQIPCIASWITGIPELIRDGVDGLLFAPSDDEALAAAIARLMDDTGLREHLAVQGRQRVLEAYHLGPSLERLAEVLKQRVEVDR